MTGPDELDLNAEPLVRELLEDPIAELLMRTDGVQRDILDPLLKTVAEAVDAREAA